MKSNNFKKYLRKLKYIYIYIYKLLLQLLKFFKVIFKILTGVYPNGHEINDLRKGYLGSVVAQP